MSLKSNLNKWRSTQLAQLDKLYINASLTKVLQICKKYYIKLKNNIFPNNSQIRIRACDDASSHHYPFPILGLKIPKWDWRLSCCVECHGMKAPILYKPGKRDHLFTGSLNKIRFYIFNNIS